MNKHNRDFLHMNVFQAMAITVLVQALLISCAVFDDHAFNPTPFEIGESMPYIRVKGASKC